MTDWFRSWHGAPTDHKWLVVARKAGTIPAIVSAVVWALLDHASQQTDRGDVRDFDVETYAATSGLEEELIRKVIGALTDKGVISDYRLTAWEKRQPKREDNSAPRVASHRERNAVKRDVTQRNAPEESREDTDKNTSPSLRSGETPAKPKKKTPISEDWQPSEKNLEDARRWGVAGPKLAVEVQKFRDHHLKLGSVFKNWDAAWRTWLQRVEAYAPRQNGTGPPPKKSPATLALERMGLRSNERTDETIIDLTATRTG